VLIKEIEKYLGDSSTIKERHLREFTTIPDWIKKDAQMWLEGKISNSEYIQATENLISRNILRV